MVNLVVSISGNVIVPLVFSSTAWTWMIETQLSKMPRIGVDVVGSIPSEDWFFKRSVRNSRVSTQILILAYGWINVNLYGG